MSILKHLFSRISPAPVEAGTKHGKAFKAQQEIQRITPPSDQLQKLDRLSEIAAGKTIVVTDISSRRKS